MSDCSWVFSSICCQKKRSGCTIIFLSPECSSIMVLKVQPPLTWPTEAQLNPFQPPSMDLPEAGANLVEMVERAPSLRRVLKNDARWLRSSEASTMGPTWMIPNSKWLITMVGKSPKLGCLPSKCRVFSIRFNQNLFIFTYVFHLKPVA